MTKVTIQGLEFNVEPAYKEGDTLNANEAEAINQLRIENLRNNFAGQVKAAREEVAETNGWFTQDGEKKVYDLDKVTNEMIDIDTLTAKFEEYENSYEFGARRAGGTRTPADPVQREAERLAKDKAKELLKSKNIKLNEVKKEAMDGLVKQILERYPAITEQARANVEAAKAITLDGLEI